MNKKRYREVCEAFSGKRVTVIGDLMMDEYLWGQATRISPESPVMVVEVKSESQVPGGAANVVNNILALGGRVSVIGVVGEDVAGEQLISSLSSRKADIHGVLRDDTRPTTRKTRIVAHNQQVLRVDREERVDLSPKMEGMLIGRMTQLLQHSDAVILSDYAKGVLTRNVIRTSIETARELNLLITANPKPQSARFMQGISVISLNQSEAEITAALIGVRETPLLFDGDRLDESGRILVGELGIENLLVTRGGKGLSLWTEAGSVTHVPAHEVEVYDVAGAGDTVISMLTLALVGGATMREALHLANHAAACVIRKVGVATVTPEELYADG